MMHLKSGTAALAVAALIGGSAMLIAPALAETIKLEHW